MAISPDRRVYLAFRPARERDAVRRLGEPIEVLSRSPSLVLVRASADTTGVR